MSKGTPKRWSPEAEAKILEAWDARTPFLKAIEFDRAHAKAHGISTSVFQRKRCELLKKRKADAWTKDWPTVPGWYWVRIGDGEPEVAKVFVTPRGVGYSRDGATMVTFALIITLWGPRIPEPEVSP